MLTPKVGIAMRLPVSPLTGYVDIALEGDARLDKNPSGANGLGIFGDQRPLLRPNGVGAEQRHENEEDDGTVSDTHSCCAPRLMYSSATMS